MPRRKTSALIKVFTAPHAVTRALTDCNHSGRLFLTMRTRLARQSILLTALIALLTIPACRDAQPARESAEQELRPELERILTLQDQGANPLLLTLSLDGVAVPIRPPVARVAQSINDWLRENASQRRVMFAMDGAVLRVLYGIADEWDAEGVPVLVFRSEDIAHERSSLVGYTLDDFDVIVLRRHILEEWTTEETHWVAAFYARTSEMQDSPLVLPLPGYRLTLRRYGLHGFTHQRQPPIRESILLSRLRWTLWHELGHVRLNATSAANTLHSESPGCFLRMVAAELYADFGKGGFCDNLLERDPVPEQMQRAAICEWLGFNWHLATGVDDSMRWYALTACPLILASLRDQDGGIDRNQLRRTCTIVGTTALAHLQQHAQGLGGGPCTRIGDIEAVASLARAILESSNVTHPHRGPALNLGRLEELMVRSWADCLKRTAGLEHDDIQDLVWLSMQHSVFNARCEGQPNEGGRMLWKSVETKAAELADRAKDEPVRRAARSLVLDCSWWAGRRLVDAGLRLRVAKFIEEYPLSVEAAWWQWQLSKDQ